MSPELIRQCLEARPFVPLNISLTDHSGYSIEHAEEAKLTDDGSALQVTQRGVRVLMALNQIVSIAFDTASGKPFGFGWRSKDA